MKIVCRLLEQIVSLYIGKRIFENSRTQTPILIMFIDIGIINIYLIYRKYESTFVTGIENSNN
jgi:hypothetical protein